MRVVDHALDSPDHIYIIECINQLLDAISLVGQDFGKFLSSCYRTAP
ncbi:hypothetical protein [Nostoc piscinale]|nr:hypothetical protein [Nostoc piscinale]